MPDEAINPNELPPLKYGTGTLVPTTQIVVDEERSRQDYGNILELMDSITRLGLAHPLVVAKRSDGKFDLIAGGRRLRALLLLGHEKVPVTVRSDMTPLERLELELAENLQRKDLEWTEEVHNLKRMDEVKKKLHGETTRGKDGQKGWTVGDTANSIGASKSHTAKKIQFAKLLEERPDLEAEVKNLPITAAMKVVDQKLKGEKVSRMADAGTLELSALVEHGSAEDLIKQVKTSSVDLILTDPPYGISEIERQEGKKRGETQSYTAGLKHEDNLSTNEVLSLFDLLAPEFARVLRPGRYFWIFLTMEHYEALSQRLANAGLSVYPIPAIWDKRKTSSPFRGYYLQPSYEAILYGWKPDKEGGKRRLSKPSRDVLSYSSLSSKAKRHPFEKPQDLLRFIIETSSLLGDFVLDPFAGSGSTLIAARDLGRKVLGFELSETHYRTTQARLLGLFQDEEPIVQPTSVHSPVKRLSRKSLGLIRGKLEDNEGGIVACVWQGGTLEIEFADGKVEQIDEVSEIQRDSFLKLPHENHEALKRQKTFGWVNE